MDFWYKNYGKVYVQPNTQVSRESFIRLYLRPKLGHIPLNKLTTNDIHQLYIWIKTDGRRETREERGNGKAEPQEVPQTPPSKTMTDFQPTKRTRRKHGTGYIKQIHEHRWSGRCTMTWPDGTTRIRTIYGKTEEECEKKLAALIVEMKAERARLKEERKAS